MEYNDKQLQIIETAEQLFAEKGFEGTSVRDIADKAGINVAMISYYFGSKEKLMEAVFEVRIGNVKMMIENLLKDETLSPLQKVNKLIDEHIEKVTEKERFFKIMICEQVVNKNPVILNAAKELKLKNAEVVAELIKEGQKKGVFKKKVDIMLMLNTMAGTVWQAMINREYYREYNNLQSLSEKEFITLIKRKLSVHLKTLFKAILTHEA